MLAWRAPAAVRRARHAARVRGRGDRGTWSCRWRGRSRSTTHLRRSLCWPARPRRARSPWSTTP